MQLNDMVLISVDDHTCEPPNLFDEAGVKRPVTSGDVLQMFQRQAEQLARRQST